MYAVDVEVTLNPKIPQKFVLAPPTLKPFWAKMFSR
jgi:hypothetical protein